MLNYGIINKKHKGAGGMENSVNSEITVNTIVCKPVEVVWKCWTEPEHITKWNNASSDWHTTACENDLRPGGKFLSRMEAKDGSFGFDFGGVYDEVITHKLISYTLGDGRKVRIAFSGKENETEIIEEFQAENVYPIEQQRNGWQAILDNFKLYTEKLEKECE